MNDIQNDSKGEIVMYQPDETIRLEVRVENDTVWLTQAQMAELFDATKQNISLHIINVYSEGELDELSTVKDCLTVRQEGQRMVKRHVLYYNLDVIISVGYRVKSLRGTRFRQWANNVLKQYMLHGYSINKRFEYIEQRLGTVEGKVDFLRHNQQYPPVNINVCRHNHDRFLIIDDTVYLFGASLKDAGKKLFAYIKMQETNSTELLRQIH